MDLFLFLRTFCILNHRECTKMIRVIGLFLFVTFLGLNCEGEHRVKYYMYAHGMERELLIDKFNDKKLKLNNRAYVFFIPEEDHCKAKIYECLVKTYETVRTNFTYIIVDWSRVGKRPLFGDQCASLIDRCNKTGHDIMTMVRKHNIAPNRVHMVGYSTGAHVAAAAAKKFLFWFMDKPYKITALDPSRKCFETLDEKNEDVRLYKDDAVIVNVLHTNAGRIGLDGDDLGTLNFYANGGTQQPGCSQGNDICCHRMSLLYFNESIVSNHFAGKECKSYKKDCKKDEFVIFGPATNLENVTINCYFDTNTHEPYGKLKGEGQGKGGAKRNE